jgi:phosphatidylinositol glycan class O
MLLLWISSLYIIGVWLFSSGFVFNRKPIHRFSSCDNVSNDYVNKMSSTVMSHTPGCQFTNRYNRALILVINGITYHFNQSIDGNNNSEQIDNNINNEEIHLIDNLINKYRNQSKIYKLSQLPSLSLIQTFKTLTTGGLPTFIDLNFNFGPFHVIEDNILNQLKSKSKRITFIADNSLKNLFSNELFEKSIYFNSNSNVRQIIIYFSFIYFIIEL